MAHSTTAMAGAKAINCANASAAATSTNSEDTANASSIVPSSAAAVGFQTLNSPCEGVPTAVSTSGAAHTQGRSLAPRRQRSRWNNPCSSRLTFDFCSISIQTILLVVFLPVFRDEPAHKALQGWVIGGGVGCLLHRIYKRFRELQSNRLPQAVLTVSQGFEVTGKSQNGWCRRFGIQILNWVWRSLDIFLELWFGVGIGIVYTRWITGQAPHLNWLCTVFLVIPYLTFILVMTVCIYDIYMEWPTTDKRSKGGDGSRVGAPPAVAAGQVIQCYHGGGIIGSEGSNLKKQTPQCNW